MMRRAQLLAAAAAVIVPGDCSGRREHTTRRVDPRLPAAAELQSYGDVQTLASSGEVNLNSRDRWGKTALYYLAKDGHVGLAQQLLEAGAIPDSQSYTHSTPLMVAVDKGHLAMVRLLLQHGADRDKVSIEGKRAVDFISLHTPPEQMLTLLESSAPGGAAASNDSLKASRKTGNIKASGKAESPVASGPRSMSVGGDELRVMTYNILNGVDNSRHRDDAAGYRDSQPPSDDAFAWPRRRDRVLSMVRLSRPSIAGFQEVTADQKDDFEAAFGHRYNFIGIGREDGHRGGEHMVLMIHKSLSIERSGSFWLSETGDIGSVGWDAADSRMVTWAIVQLRRSKRRALVLNTHLDHAGPTARVHTRLALLGSFSIGLLGQRRRELAWWTTTLSRILLAIRRVDIAGRRLARNPTFRRRRAPR